MSTEQDLRALVISVVCQIAPDVDPAAIDPDAALAEQLDIDSMDFLNIVVEINARTGIEIPERDYPKLSDAERCRRLPLARPGIRCRVRRLGTGRGTRERRPSASNRR